ncbi:MAG: hypothetical protein Q4C85_02950 [Actinomyces sp.]|uniref:hypothetical protein n=1 Tax=Actinomyces sp. TaxID=29317 RepID=UPI0026DA893A|nr:hypothetical protein [Actinomyces sp.]MDO4242712.1 hypothetical protein [Actinomyces sp.]
MTWVVVRLQDDLWRPEPLGPLGRLLRLDRPLRLPAAPWRGRGAPDGAAPDRTAPGFLLSTAVAEDPDADGNTLVSTTPAGWIGPPGDGQVHHDPLTRVQYQDTNYFEKTTVAAAPEPMSGQ